MVKPIGQYGRCILSIGGEVIGMWNDRYFAVQNMNDAIRQLDPFQMPPREDAQGLCMPDGRIIPQPVIMVE